jgi:hypoxanthine phosphoribosyltransferase
MLEEGISKVLISEEEIVKIVNRLGVEITERYSEEEGELLVVGLLKGSFVFMADLIRQIKLPLHVDFMTVSSYGSGTASSGEVRIDKDLGGPVEGKNVLMVEDIIDTGRTLNRVLELIESRNPRSLLTCTFVDKPSRRIEDVEIAFSGPQIPDEYICGYGLDFDQQYRNLPYIGVLDQKIVSFTP